MVSFREKWLTMDASCHAKYINHHCWFDALALIMQTGYEVSSLSVPVISRINERRIVTYKIFINKQLIYANVSYNKAGTVYIY